MYRSSLCFFFFFAIAYGNASYEGHRLIRATPKIASDMTSLAALHIRSDSTDGISFLDDVRRLNQPVHIVVAPERLDPFLRDLQRLKIQFDIVRQNLQRVIEEEKRINTARKRSLPGDSFDFQRYHTLDEIYDHLDDVQSKHADVQVRTIGKTYEGRDMKVISTGDGSKPSVFYECGIHAREWISPATCLLILNDILTSSEDDVKLLRNSFDFHMLMVANPDGYAYTWASDRLWRKNRRPTGLSGCIGIDLNRNFNASFGGIGSSRLQCLEIYRGPHSFSENETQAERDYMLGLKNLKSVWAVHSYGQILMFPRCSTCKNVKEFDDLNRLTNRAADAIEKTHGQKYTHGACGDAVYLCGGVQTDWAYNALKVKHSFDIELRDYGEHSFLLPKEQIQPAFEEAWNGMKVILNDALQTV